MNKKLLLLAFVVSAIGLGFYAYLGGFNSPDVVITTSKTQYIAGKYFEGPVNHENFGKLFQDAAEVLETKKLTGNLANLYYNNPQEREDTIKAFIGIALPDSSAGLPPGYTLRKIAGGKKVVQASIKAHFLMAPNRLYKALFEYGEKNKIKLQESYLEQFLEDNHAVVQAEILR